MKSKNIFNKIFVAGALAIGAGFVSCEDYLTVLPSDRITEDDFWKNKADLNNVRSAAYKQMATSGVTSRILYWGELRSDNLEQNKMNQTSLEMLRRAVLHPTDNMFDWSHFYTGINYCNKVLEQGEKMTEPGKEVDPSFRKGDWLPIKAEMLSMRALYYLTLVRAYRDVPFVTTSISTDAQALAGKIGATPGAAIISSLIKDLEEAKTYAAQDYGNARERKGRITKRGVRAILADLYLWRSCLLQKAFEKGDSYMLKDGEIVILDSVALDSAIANGQVKAMQSALDAMSRKDLVKVIDNCDTIMQSFREEYDKDLVSHPEWNDDEDRNKDYPYMLFVNSKSSRAVFDNVYSDLWGNKNSKYESIFELQYDGNILKNSTLNDYLSSYNSGNLSPGSMVGSGVMTGSAESNYNPSRGYGKADIRMVETFVYTPSNAQRVPFRKNVARSIIIPDLKNVVSQEISGDPNYRNSDSQDGNWPFYRLTDVMLMKAEAIARYTSPELTIPAANAKPEEFTTPVNLLLEGFNLVNAIYARCNPGLEPTGTPNAGEAVSDRLDPVKNYAAGKTASQLLNLTYNERQREFIGEGKRWFDLVRQAEATNNVKGTLTDFIQLTDEVKNRLRLLYSLYVPIYSEELKVNGVEYGGKLKQNPVWDRYTVK